MWNFNDVKRIEYKSGYSYLIEFDDGVSAVIDFSEYLERGPVFTPLRDLEKFRQARIEGARSPGPMGRTLHRRLCTRSVNRRVRTTPCNRPEIFFAFQGKKSRGEPWDRVNHGLPRPFGPRNDQTTPA